MAHNGRPRIAIPMPHSLDREYAERAIPQYERAVHQAGGEPLRIALGQTPDEVRNMIEDCDAVLLPGSNADVDPSRFSAPRSRHTAPADPSRDAIDNLLLEDAYKLRKPILGICYGLQSLNVYHGGSLIQHIPDFLPEKLRTQVNHEAGKAVAIAHSVKLENDSKLSEIVNGGGAHVLPVNSSHHQSADRIGIGLRISARCSEDGIVEALEGTAPDHFVLAVQWHPERSVESDEASRSIFRALVQAAK